MKTRQSLNYTSYRNALLDFFPTVEGYVHSVPIDRAGNFSFHYIYNYTDHLGNIRLKYTKHPQTGNIQILEETEERGSRTPMKNKKRREQNSYYPFGLKHEGYNPIHEIIEVGEPMGDVTIIPVTEDLGDPYKFKFNGKEYQDEFGLDWYDYGARNYQADLGRWMNVDPLAEKYLTLSPYVYVANNPILLRDPDGKRIDFSFTYDDEGRISSMNIHVTGKVIDNTKRGLSNKRMQTARNKIVDGISNIQITGEGVDINFTSNIEIANKEEDIDNDDHVYR